MSNRKHIIERYKCRLLCYIKAVVVQVTQASSLFLAQVDI